MVSYEKKKKAFDKIKSFGEKQEHESFKSIETMCWMHNFTNIQVQCMLNFAYTFSPDPLNSTIYTKVLSFLFEQRKKKVWILFDDFHEQKKTTINWLRPFSGKRNMIFINHFGEPLQFHIQINKSQHFWFKWYMNWLT